MNDVESPSGGLVDTRVLEMLERKQALEIMDEAWSLYESRSADQGEDALHRVEVLRLLSKERMSPRRVARLLGGEAGQVQRDHAEARVEFQAALRVVVGTHAECAGRELDAAVQQIISKLGRKRR